MKTRIKEIIVAASRGLSHLRDKGGRTGTVPGFGWRLPLFAMLALLWAEPTMAATGNISETDKYAWSENAGWINFRPTYGGVAVYDTYLSGYAWAEKIGWIKLGHDSGGPYLNTLVINWGVNKDASGNLSGYGWSETAGWINFKPNASQVTINPVTGNFDGYAWGENIGWISFKGISPAYKVAYLEGAPTVVNVISDIVVADNAANEFIDLTNVFDDAYNDNAAIVKTVLSNSNTTIVLASISENTLTLDYQTNQSGVATITIRATSNGQIVDDTFIVTVSLAEGLKISESDGGISGIERADGGSDNSNKDTATNNPKVDVEYNFELTLLDAGGDPTSVKVYISDRTNPVAGDFYSYDLDCAGDMATGATCSYSTMFGPAAKHKFYFEAVLADGTTTVRYPATADTYITGPTTDLLNGYSMVGMPRDINVASLDPAAWPGGCSTVYRWVSEGLSIGASNNGAYELVDAANPLKTGEGYFVNKESCGDPASASMPEMASSLDITDASYSIALSSGWNMVSNPYAGNVMLSNVQVQKGAEAAVSWTDAAASDIVINALYYYKGSDWGSTYFSESAGGVPDAKLLPWASYWIYLEKDDDVYKLVITKP